MRPAWLNLLLALSLAANVVEVAIPFWNHYRWLHMERPEYRSAPHQAARRHMKVLVPARQLEAESLRHEHDQLNLRREMLTFDEPPDTVALRMALDSTMVLDRELYRLSYLSMRAVVESGNVKQRRGMEKRWRRQMNLEDMPRVPKLLQKTP